MHEIMKKTKKDLSRFDSEIKDQENKIAEDKKILEQKTKEAESLQSRLEKVTEKKEQLESEYDSKRTERQNALFEEKDITAINGVLKKIQEQLEIKTDETISIQNKLDAVNAEAGKITESLNAAETTLNELLRRREAYQVCINYNAAAEPFAQALQAYYDFIGKNQENKKLFAFGTDYTGQASNGGNINIDSVAKLYVPEHKAVFHSFDEVPVGGLEGSTMKTNVRNYPETWNWFKK